MERDKRQEDPGMGARPQVWRVGHLLRSTVQRTACTAYPVTRPSSHYCVRCTYATYETTSCVSGLVAESQALVYSLPGLGGGLGGKRERDTCPGGDRSQYTWKGLRAREEYARLMWKQTNHLGPFAALPARYVPFSSIHGWQGGVDQTWSWPVGTEGSSAVPSLITLSIRLSLYCPERAEI